MVAPQTPSPFSVRDRAGVAAYPRTLRFPRPLEEDTQPKLKKYYQPRKSHRTVSMTLQGTKVALYGGASLAVTDSAGSKVPLRLEFEICSRGDVVGRLVRTKHHRHVSCAVVMDSTKTKPMKISKNSCTYDRVQFSYILSPWILSDGALHLMPDITYSILA